MFCKKSSLRNGIFPQGVAAGDAGWVFPSDSMQGMLEGVSLHLSNLSESWQQNLLDDEYGPLPLRCKRPGSSEPGVAEPDSPKRLKVDEEAPSSPVRLPRLPLDAVTPRAPRLRHGLKQREAQATRIKELGVGAFGEVVLFRVESPGGTVETLAVKKAAGHPDAREVSANEVRIMRALGEVLGVVRMHEGLTTLKSLVLEFCRRGDLLGRLESLNEHWASNPVGDPCLKEAMLIHLLLGPAFGLMSVHAKGVLHLDVKPENILLFNRLSAGLSDFGLAADDVIGQPLDWRGTPVYMAPEMLRKDGFFSPAQDIWSFGCVALITFYGLPLYSIMDKCPRATALKRKICFENKWEPGFTGSSFEAFISRTPDQDKFKLLDRIIQQVVIPGRVFLGSDLQGAFSGIDAVLKMVEEEPENRLGALENIVRVGGALLKEIMASFGTEDEFWSQMKVFVDQLPQPAVPAVPAASAASVAEATEGQAAAGGPRPGTRRGLMPEFDAAAVALRAPRRRGRTATL